MRARNWYLWGGMALVLLAGAGGRGWGVATATVWAFGNLALMLVPPAGGGEDQ